MTDNRDAFGRLGVYRFGLFGSFVTGKQNSESDVDLLVEFKPGTKSFDNFMDLSFLLEEFFGRKVDLVTSRSVHILDLKFSLRLNMALSIENKIFRHREH